LPAGSWWGGGKWGAYQNDKIHKTGIPERLEGDAICLGVEGEGWGGGKRGVGTKTPIGENECLDLLNWGEGRGQKKVPKAGDPGGRKWEA